MKDVASLHFELENILKNTAHGVFLLNRGRKFVLFNRACEEITGISPLEVLGTGCKCDDEMDCEAARDQSPSLRLCPGMTVFEGKITSVSVRQRMQLRRKDLSNVWVEVTYTPMRNRDDQVECVLGVVRDISEVKAKEEQLRRTTENLSAQLELVKSGTRERYGFNSIVSQSDVMRDVFERIRAACNNSSSVLICGESGTGKEVIARTIHDNGQQKNGPFVPLNCSALSKDLIESELFGHTKGAFTGATSDFEGLFRAAHGGTIFLDEIAEMPTETQAKLLRTLQDKTVRPVGSAKEIPVNARVIAATNRPIKDALAGGFVRKDLYYRLSVISVDVPVLAQRKEDIPFLVQHFVTVFNRQSVRQVQSVSPEVWNLLLKHDWPGNVRELQNVIESAFAIGAGPELTAEELPPTLRGEAVDIYGSERLDVALDTLLEQVERRAILAALKRSQGRYARAARAMGISRSRLYRRMEALDIKVVRQV